MICLACSCWIIYTFIPIPYAIFYVKNNSIPPTYCLYTQSWPLKYLYLYLKPVTTTSALPILLLLQHVFLLIDKYNLYHNAFLCNYTFTLILMRITDISPFYIMREYLWVTKSPPQRNYEVVNDNIWGLSFSVPMQRIMEPIKKQQHYTLFIF